MHEKVIHGFDFLETDQLRTYEISCSAEVIQSVPEHLQIVILHKPWTPSQRLLEYYASLVNYVNSVWD